MVHTSPQPGCSTLSVAHFFVGGRTWASFAASRLQAEHFAELSVHIKYLNPFPPTPAHTHFSQQVIRRFHESIADVLSRLFRNQVSGEASGRGWFYRANGLGVYINVGNLPSETACRLVSRACAFCLPKS